MKTGSESDEVLLYDIAYFCGCEYLSDIKSLENGYVFRCIKDKISLQNYCPSVWSKAIAYIIENPIRFATIQEVEAYISTNEYV